MPTAIAYLLLTVAFESFGTACIQASQQFSRPWPSLGVVLGYAASFWFLSQALRSLPLAVVYATWSGLGVITISVIGYVVFGQKISLSSSLGLAMVLGGIVTLQLTSSTAP